jgi:hypothetical protein
MFRDIYRPEGSDNPIFVEVVGEPIRQRVQILDNYMHDEHRGNYDHYPPPPVQPTGLFEARINDSYHGPLTAGYVYIPKSRMLAVTIKSGATAMAHGLYPEAAENVAAALLYTALSSRAIKAKIRVEDKVDLPLEELGKSGLAVASLMAGLAGKRRWLNQVERQR